MPCTYCLTGILQTPSILRAIRKNRKKPTRTKQENYAGLYGLSAAVNGTAVSAKTAGGQTALRSVKNRCHSFRIVVVPL